MIVPIVEEDEWLRVLDGIPRFVPPVGRVLIVAPHPDDETLGAGGLTAALCVQGVEVAIAAVTDGENAYPDEPDLGQVRRREQSEALAILGVRSSRVHRFGLPDSDVSSHEEELSHLLESLVTPHTYILAPWQRDYHPDHEACGRAAARIAAQTGAQLFSYLFWTWHRGTAEDLESCDLVAYPLTARLLATKTEALCCHRSQLQHPSGQPILPENLLGPAKRSFEVFVRA